MRGISQLLSAALMCGMTAAVGGCATAGPSAAGAGKTYVGPVEGAPESARVGIVASGTDFIAYVCSHDEAFNMTHARWFSGKSGDGGAFDALQPDGAQIQGSIQGDRVV